MGAYGSPEHIPDDNQSPSKKRKKGIIYSDLPVWKKALLVLYALSLTLLALIMFLTLETYTGNKVAGALLSVAFLALGILFISRIGAHKRAWPFVLCSVIAFFAYFGIEPSDAVQTANQSSNASSTQSQSSNTNSVPSVQSKTPSVAPADEVLKVDYKTLYKDYEDNPIKADSKYRNKKLQLTGVVANIDRDIGQHPYITFNIDEYGSKSIKMSFDSDDAVMDLKKGETVTVSGMCGGTFASVVVVLNDCILVK